jgi:serine protease Do
MQSLAQSIFKINTANGSGSAFYLQSHGIFITNHHVVDGSRKVSVENSAEDRFEGTVVMVDTNEDIAIVKVNQDFPGLPDIKLADAKELLVRDAVFVLGYPFGMPYTETQGIVSAPRQLMDSKYYVQTDAPINPGNSGGPLVNQAGEVIGITTSKFSEADNMGFAIPVATLEEILGIYKENQPVSFSVVCPGCRSLTREATEYCATCGGGFDAEIFEESAVSDLAELIECGLIRNNINPILARTGDEYWSFYRGSSQIRIFVFKDNYVFSTSPINKLISKKMPELLTYMLSNPVKPYYLGIANGEIYLSYRVHISDLNNDHFGAAQLDNLVLLAQKADETDNFFNEAFGCPFSAEAKLA